MFESPGPPILPVSGAPSEASDRTGSQTLGGGESLAGIQASINFDRFDSLQNTVVLIRRGGLGPRR